MYIIYRVINPNRDQAYYGYARADNIEEARKTFMVGGNRNNDQRNDVKFIGETPPEELRFEMVDIADDEYEAWMARNDARSANVDAFTGPTHWPSNHMMRAQKEHPERVAKWKGDELINLPTARAAYGKGLWTFKQVIAATKGVDNKQTKQELDTMTPKDFASKYGLPV